MARILLIDDNEDVRLSMCAILESEGHQVVSAAGGEGGMRAQRESPVSRSLVGRNALGAPAR